MWVQAHKATKLWSGPDDKAVVLTDLPQWTFLKVSGLERSGRIVTSAALIVVVVAGSFAFADIVLIKALGLGMAIAVALDATVVRALLVPATMRLLGKWNWWLPSALERRLPAIEGAEARA